jgi:hypothetical protein
MPLAAVIASVIVTVGIGLSEVFGLFRGGKARQPTNAEGSVRRYSSG